MTVLNVRHTTVYRYSRPVVLGDHRLMLRPRDSRPCNGFTRSTVPATGLRALRARAHSQIRRALRLPRRSSSRHKSSRQMLQLAGSVEITSCFFQQSREEEAKSGQEQEEKRSGSLTVHVGADDWQRRSRQEILNNRPARLGPLHRTRVS